MRAAIARVRRAEQGHAKGNATGTHRRARRAAAASRASLARAATRFDGYAPGGCADAAARRMNCGAGSQRTPTRLRNCGGETKSDAPLPRRTARPASPDAAGGPPRTRPRDAAAQRQRLQPQGSPAVQPRNALRPQQAQSVAAPPARACAVACRCAAPEQALCRQAQRQRATQRNESPSELQGAVRRCAWWMRPRATRQCVVCSRACVVEAASARACCAAGAWRSIGNAARSRSGGSISARARTPGAS
jgi:hypothetical protein